MAWRRTLSLFAMIRNTHAHSPRGVLSAYQDNAAVIEGWPGSVISRIRSPASTARIAEPIDILMKVETHKPPDGDLAISRRLHRFGRRDPR